MSKNMIKNYLTKYMDVEKVRMRIADQCAPVIMGIKISNLITIPVDAKILLFKMLKKTGISHVLLYESQSQCIIFLYRKEMLCFHLQGRDNRSFLSDYGYEDQSLNGMLKRMKERLVCYYAGMIQFPHEMGVFLEYPIDDIVGFIKNKGKHSLLSGYWKVYKDPEKAKETFKEYDMARKEVLSGILNGKKIYEIGNSAKQKCYA